MNQSKVMNDDIITDSVSRRQFLKTATIGAMGALILQQKAHAFSLGDSPRVITILGIIDITQSLADREVSKNIYWIDNNRLLGSQNEGTDTLVTSVKNGDIINWIITGLEVETMVSIYDIKGSAVPITSAALDPTSPFGSWKGVVNADHSGSYLYNITLLVENMVLPMTTALTLVVV